MQANSLKVHAKVAKLVDALDSGSSAFTGMRVQVPPFAPQLTCCKRHWYPTKWRFAFLPQTAGLMRLIDLSMTPVATTISHGLSWIGMVLLLLAGPLSCAKSGPERHLEPAEAQLKDALDLLRQAHGKQRALLAATLAYRADHGAQIQALRVHGGEILNQLNGDERIHWQTESQNRLSPVLAQIELASQQFLIPEQALAVVMPLLVQATPKATGQRPWLPPVPPSPFEQSGPAPGLPGAHSPGSAP